MEIDRFILSTMKDFTIFYAFILFIAIIQQTELIKGLIAAGMFIMLIWVSLDMQEYWEKNYPRRL